MLRQVKTENGWVKGIPAADPRITAFKGIPFAAPPVGKNRWRAPQPAESWEGVLECYQFGPAAVQAPIKADPNALYDREWNVDPDIAMSEDCLQLNVWTNAKTGDEKMPVMVWIYGGGLTVGNPAEMEFDGERIARRGVILVSVNYRVNVFGFLAHPALTAEAPDYPTNFGHLDQRAGIAWVRRNIAAFGGDPDNITIFGQSAGAGSVQSQLCSPLTKGLFHKAILQSFGGMLPPSNLSQTLAEAEAQGVLFFDKLGVKTLEEARAIEAKKVWEIATSDRSFFWHTVVGDPFMPDFPTEIIKRGEHHDMPLILGDTADEFPLTPWFNSVEELEAYAKETFGERANEYLAIVKKNASSLETLKKNATFNSVELGNVLWLDLNLVQKRSPMYFYCFDPEIPGWDNPGAFHSSELWFTFETLAKCWRPFVGKHYDLARQMCNYWTNFAKNGDPNGLDADGTPMPEWGPYASDRRGPMFFGDTAGMIGPSTDPLFNFLRKAYQDGIAGNELGSFAAMKIMAAKMHR